MTDIVKLVNDITEEFLRENGLEIWSVEYEKEGKEYFLRVYIDKTGISFDNSDLLEEGEWSESYVSTDDCEKVSGFLSEKLDELDPIEGNYYLEVSSPGMDRELVTDRHYEKCKGQMVDIVLREKFDDQTVWQGKLTEKNENTVTIEVTIDTKAANRKPGAKVSPKSLVVKNLVIPIDIIKSVKLAVIF